MYLIFFKIIGFYNFVSNFVLKCLPKWELIGIMPTSLPV